MTDSRIHSRPLSPHLSVYKREWTMVYSILHRITGILLAFGMVLLILWLASLAGGQTSYQTAVMLLSSVIGRIIIFAVSLAFFYHLINGIRHLLWDTGIGLSLVPARMTGHWGAFFACCLTLLFWLIAYDIFPQDMLNWMKG